MVLIYYFTILYIGSPDTTRQSPHLRVSPGVVKVSVGLHSHLEAPGKKSTSMLTQAVGRYHFLVVV